MEEKPQSAQDNCLMKCWNTDRWFATREMKMSSGEKLVEISTAGFDENEEKKLIKFEALFIRALSIKLLLKNLKKVEKNHKLRINSWVL